MSAEVPSDNRISYRIVDQIGPKRCIVGPIDDPNKIYILGTDNEFHHVTSWSLYLDMGFDPNSQDVVDIPLDLYQEYGHGAAIESIGNYHVAISESNSGDGGQVPEPYNLTAEASSSCIFHWI